MANLFTGIRITNIHPIATSFILLQESSAIVTDLVNNANGNASFGLSSCCALIFLAMHRDDVSKPLVSTMLVRKPVTATNDVNRLNIINIHNVG